MSRDVNKVNVTSDKEVSITQEANGKKVATTNGFMTVKLDFISSIGIKNLADIESYTINRIVGSVSHCVKFHGGGVLQFSFTDKGQLIELISYQLLLNIVNISEVLFERDLSQVVNDRSHRG